MSSEDLSANIFTRKEALHRNTEKYKQAIEEQVDILKENAGQISKVVLVIGGTLAISYLLVKLLTRSGRRRRQNFYQIKDDELRVPYHKEESIIVRTIKGYIATFLIAIAQQKLQEVIAHFKEPHAEADFKETNRE